VKLRVLVAAAFVLLIAAGTGSARTAGAGRELLLVSARTGAVDRSFPDVGCCNVLAASTDGHGGWFIAGDFSRVGRDGVAHIAHLHPNGTLDTRWHGRAPRSPAPNRGYPVTTMVRVGATLYVANPFWVAALDARTGARRWLHRLSWPRGGHPGLAASRSVVFVAEGRTKLDGVRRDSPIALDARTGAVLPWHAALQPPYLDAYPLALDRGRLFVGAYSANGYVEKLLAVDARTGRRTGWQAPQISELGTIFVTHGLVFTTSLDGSYVASARTGRPALAGIRGTVFAAAGDTLYVGGDVRQGSSFADKKRDNLGAVDLRTGKVTGWAPKFHRRYVIVEALAADRAQVLVAGSFTNSLG
jgi:PQQ-like domain